MFYFIFFRPPFERGGFNLRALLLRHSTLFARFDWGILRASRALIGAFYALRAFLLGHSTCFARFDLGFLRTSRAFIGAFYALRAL